ncbi:hypothetical protein [Fodinicola acaciae]|uniref:hypothetical protein n=1 Tax=Fodinicola acaciae TaxID=2681555 RepID=UPI0013D62B20|nr:hypothetical protein [Fodinicola acaciae]
MVATIRDRIERLSDRMLGRLVPKMTADAVVCTWAKCGCGYGFPPTMYLRQAYQLRDELHDTACGDCALSNDRC